MIPDQHLAAKAFKANTGVPAAPQRKDLYQAANDATRALGLKGNCCSLLKTLVGFYSPNEGVKGLMVWPSNAKLIDALGVSASSLSVSLRALQEAGLIVARTSANGKRFALKDRNSGKIKDAYGFDLSPLLARKHEFAAAVAAQDRSREELKARKAVLGATRRELKILRDGFAKLNLPDLQEQADRAAASALTSRSNKTTIENVDQLLLAAESARTRLEQAYLEAFKLEAFEAEKRGGDATKKISSDAEMCNHSYNNPDPNFTETCFRQTRESENSGLGGGRKDETTKTFNEENAEPKKEALEERGMRSPAPKVLDPILWHQACPALESYTTRQSMPEVLEAGRLMSLMLGISKRGIDRCYRTLGSVLFPLLCVYVHQLYADDQERDRPTLRNPGGLVVSMAKEIASGQRDLSAGLVALSEKQLHRKLASPRPARENHSPRELEEMLDAVPAQPLRQSGNWAGIGQLTSSLLSSWQGKVVNDQGDRDG